MTLICETEGLRLDLFLSQAVPGSAAVLHKISWPPAASPATGKP